MSPQLTVALLEVVPQAHKQDLVPKDGKPTPNLTLRTRLVCPPQHVSFRADPDYGGLPWYDYGSVRVATTRQVLKRTQWTQPASGCWLDFGLSPTGVDFSVHFKNCTNVSEGTLVRALTLSCTSTSTTNAQLLTTRRCLSTHTR